MVIDFIKELIFIEAEKIRKWAIKANNGCDNLVNWCAICSYLIFKRLDKYNLNPVFCAIVTGPGSHCFIYCHNYIVDVTATQFGVKTEVVVRKNYGRHKLYFWNLKSERLIKFVTIQDIEDHLDTWNWECHPKHRFLIMKQRKVGLCA